MLRRRHVVRCGAREGWVRVVKWCATGGGGGSSGVSRWASEEVYAIQAVDVHGQARIVGSITMPVGAGVAPRSVTLAGNVPNPFNPSTSIQFTLGRRGSARLEVYDARGARVRTLWSGVAAAGAHVRVWDGRDGDGKGVASGVYVARLVTEDGVRTRKMMLLK